MHASFMDEMLPIPLTADTPFLNSFDAVLLKNSASRVSESEIEKFLKRAKH